MHTSIKFKKSADNQSNISAEAKSPLPVNHLQNARFFMWQMFKSFGLFISTGFKWLFTNYPHKTWGIVLFLSLTSSILISIRTIGSARAERDAYSKENAALLDSISKLKNNKLSYTTISNIPINPSR